MRESSVSKLGKEYLETEDPHRVGLRLQELSRLGIIGMGCEKVVLKNSRWCNREV